MYQLNFSFNLGLIPDIKAGTFKIYSATITTLDVVAFKMIVLKFLK